MLTSAQQRTGRGLTLLLAVASALVAGAAGGYFLASRAKPTETAKRDSDTPATARDRVTALGRLQPASGVVPVFGPPGDRIAKLYPIAPGTALKADVPIAELASRRERLLEIEVAKIQLKEAKLSHAAAKRAGEKKIQAAEAELAQAKANKVSDLSAIEAKLEYLALQTAAADTQLRRLEKLKTGGVTVADEDLEKVKLLLAQAKAEEKATVAIQTKTKTTYEETEKAAQAKIDAAKAELEEALARAPIESSEKKVALAEQLGELTILKAPIAGTVLKVIGREGQPTGLEPILQLADLGKMTAVAEVYESDVERLASWVRTGAVTAEITNPALPKPLKGTLRSESDITRMIARNQVFAMGPREDADRRVIEVIVHLDDASAADAGRFVGLQVTIAFVQNK